MNPMWTRDVVLALDDLETDLGFKDLWDSTDFNAQKFRQEVAAARSRCFEPQAPTVEEMKGRLQRLHALCAGNLASFAPFIVKAQDALRT